MRHRYYLAAAICFLASSAHAGRPLPQQLICPVGDEKFNVKSTTSCTTFGGSQDFLLKVRTSCDFTTKLAQCPSNKLPMYKKFSADEVKLLESYVESDEYKSYQNRSRFMLARKVDDYLVSKGSDRMFGGSYLLGGLQYDRANTLGDAEYISLVQKVGAQDLDDKENRNGVYMGLIVAYIFFTQGNFEQATNFLDKAKARKDEKSAEFVDAYADKLGKCIAAKDTKLCPLTQPVIEPKKRAS